MNETNTLSTLAFDIATFIALVVVTLLLAIIIIRFLFIFVMSKIDNAKSYKSGITYKPYNGYLLVEYQSFEKHKQKLMDEQFKLGSVLNVGFHHYPIEIISQQTFTLKPHNLFDFRKENRYYYQPYKEEKPSTSGDTFGSFQGVFIKDSQTRDIKSTVTSHFTNEISEIQNNASLDEDDREFLLETVNTLITSNKVSKKSAKEFLDITTKVIDLGQAIPALIQVIRSFL